MRTTTTDREVSVYAHMPMKGRRAVIAASLLAVVRCGGGDAPSTDADAAEASASMSFPAVSAGTDADADLVELSDYALSLDDLRSWNEANLNLQRFAQQNPAAAAALENVAGESSLDAIEERIENVPGARDAIEDAGLSPRDYGLITLALLQGGMAQVLVEQGRSVEDVANELQVNPANIRFMTENAQEIERMRREYQVRGGGS